MQNTWDYWLLERLNHWLASSTFVSRQAIIFNGSDLPELIVACCLVALWFLKGFKIARSYEIRSRVLLMVFAFVPGYIIAKLLEITFHRSRPLINVPLEIPRQVKLELSWELQKTILYYSGSFTSKHEVMFFIFSTFAFTINKNLGIISLLFSVYFGILQIAIGYHWPSDIIGGALLGYLVALAILSIKPLLKNVLGSLVLQFKRYPAQAYTISFLLLSDFVQRFRYLKQMLFMVFHYRVFH